MARILIKLEAPETADVVRRTLEGANHRVDEVPGAGPAAEGPAKLARALADGEADLAVLDFLAEDALTVKAMQMARDRAPHLKFILILNEPVGAEHLILALNEGAMAVINAPVKPETLLNYVGRGLAAQKEDKARSEDLERLQRVADHEKSCSDEQAMEVGRCKRQLRLNYRLINRLMTTPRAAIGQTRVLLVSDSAYQLELFQKHLENAGLTVLTAPDGLKGLDEARASRPRIIVSDLEMPGLGGLELCREIKNDEALAPNHFIICTASEDKIEDVLKPEHKVDDCLVKPSRPEQFEEFTARVALGLLV